MTTVAILFWAGVFLVFYTYLGYGILLWLLVKIREAVHPARRYAFPADPPEVTLLIAAYNEQEVVAEKMANCRALDYPAGKLRVTWITDGSTDRTVELLAAYPEVTVLHDPRRDHLHDHRTAYRPECRHRLQALRAQDDLDGARQIGSIEISNPYNRK